MLQSLAFDPAQPNNTSYQPIQLVANIAELLEIARDKFECDHKSAKASLALAASMLQSELQRHAATKREVGPGELAAWQAQRLRAYIDSHLSEAIYVKDLSRVAKRSTAHFCRAFKRTFGQTPHAYVTGRRLQHAMALMLEGDEPLSVVALMCGFTDQAHLSKLFRLHTGETPAAWRRRRVFDVGIDERFSPPSSGPP